MKKFIAMVCGLLMQPIYAVQILDPPGTSFGSNLRKSTTPLEDRTWGWNNDSDYDLTITHRVDRFRNPATSIGARTHINKATPIRINNTYKPMSEPPDVNPGLTQPTKE